MPKFNIQKRFSQLLGFEPGVVPNISHSPEGVTRSKLINTLYEAQGGLYKMNIYGSDFAVSGSPLAEINPLGATIAYAHTGTGQYTITMTEVPAWLNLASNTIGVRIDMNVSNGTQGNVFWGAATWSAATRTLTIAVNVADSSDNAPVDIETTEIVTVDVFSLI